MKQLIIDKINPNGIFLDVDEAENAAPAIAPDPFKSFFEGLASADTNSIAKIRALAREFLNVEGK